MSDIIKNVFVGQRPEDVTAEMAQRVRQVVYEYSGRTSVAVAIGVLHVVAAEILAEHPNN